MNYRLTIALLLVAAALGIGVLLVPAGRSPTPTPAPVVSVLSFDVEKAASLKLSDAQGTNVTVQKQDSKWVVLTPKEAAGDNRRLSSLVSRLADLSASGSFEPTEPLASYGLASPGLTIEIELSDGTSHQLRMGNQTPDRRSSYLMVDDRAEVFLVPNFVVDDARSMIASPPYLPPTPTVTP